MTRRVILPKLQRQKGAATLVVVMMLFLIMALLAAYANRSLMFEQRISAGYYRASLAQEIAEGGIDWTVAMLNGTGIDANCQPLANGGTRFVDKYMNVSEADRGMQAISTPSSSIVVDCVRTGSALSCRCPAPGNRTTQPATVVAGNLVPSVGIALGTDSPNTHQGSFRVSAQGCTDSSVDSCADNRSDARSLQTLGASVQWASIALISAVPTPPSSPLTVKGVLTTAGTGGLGLHNTDPGSAGTLVVSGGSAPALVDSRMDSVPGTPTSQARSFDNPDLQAMSNRRFFQLHMGMTSSRYRNHPSLREVSCGAGDCGPALLAAYNAGSRVLWVQGPMNISSNVVLGTLSNPVLVVVDGTVALSGPMQLTGMLVSTGDLAWVNTGGLTSMITGMVLVQGDMTATGSMDIRYLQSVANQLRNRVGSYAKISGGWIDGDQD